MNWSSFYGLDARKQYGNGAYLSLGLAKQLADLKFAVSLGYKSQSYGAILYGAKEHFSTVNTVYLDRSTYPMPTFDRDSIYAESRYYTDFSSAQLNLTVERRFANWYTIGFGLQNDFVIQYSDTQVLRYQEVIDYRFVGDEITIGVPQEYRGFRNYQLGATAFIGRQIRRDKLKMDWGLTASTTLTSITKRIPESGYIQYFGFYTRLYFIPKVY